MLTPWVQSSAGTLSWAYTKAVSFSPRERAGHPLRPGPSPAPGSPLRPRDSPLQGAVDPAPTGPVPWGCCSREPTPGTSTTHIYCLGCLHVVCPPWVCVLILSREDTVSLARGPPRDLILSSQTPSHAPLCRPRPRSQPPSEVPRVRRSTWEFWGDISESATLIKHRWPSCQWT